MTVKHAETQNMYQAIIFVCKRPTRSRLFISLMELGWTRPGIRIGFGFVVLKQGLGLQTDQASFMMLVGGIRKHLDQVHVAVCEKEKSGNVSAPKSDR